MEKPFFTRFVGARKIALALCSIIFALFIAELAARFAERKAAAYYYSYYNLGNRLWALTAFRPSPMLGWEHTPNVYEFNSLGFVNPEYPKRKKPGTYRIMLIGDSLAEGYGLFLLRKINSNPALAGHVEVWDLGVGGYNIAQIASMLKRRGLRYHPDLVILFVCLKDLDPGIPTLYKTKDHFFALRWQGTRPITLAFGPLWRWSALYRLATLKYLDIKFSHGERPLPSREDFGMREVGRIKTACLKAHVPLRAFIFPYLMPWSKYSPRQKNDYQIWKRVLLAQNLEYFDLSPMLDGRAMEKLRGDPGDYIHFNNQGRAMVMNLVYRILLRHHYLTKRNKG
ncbi:MAG: GDSL-type esterase/lipase family protein [Elusimicrobiota bacterium]